MMDVMNYSNEELIQKINSLLNKVESIVINNKIEEVFTDIFVGNALYGMMNMENSILGNMPPDIVKSFDIFQSILVYSRDEGNQEIENTYSYKEFSHIVKEIYLMSQILVDRRLENEELSFPQMVEMGVLGKIYPALEREYFEGLFMPFDTLLERTYSLSAKDLIDGILHIAESNRLLDTEEISSIITSDKEDLKKHSVAFFEKFNVQKLVNWPFSFIQDLSYKMGSLEKPEHDLPWILLNLPIREKPFIEIQGKVYCLSGQAFIDSIYRSVLRVLREKFPNENENINNIQQEMSENFSLELITSMLPNSECYSSLEYKAPTGEGKKSNWCEVDGIILYDDVMLIIEVKSGGISAVTPVQNENYYTSSIKKLASHPFEQGKRLYEQYKKNGNIELYRRNGRNRNLIKKVQDINLCIICCITVDNFNEIAAQIEKTSFIKDENIPVWCISLSDLMVYTKLIDSPSMFLNYLYQRSKVKEFEFIKLNDELDHLGLFLEHNDYSRILEDLMKENDASCNLIVDGCREEIDMYMASLMHKSIEGENIFEYIKGEISKPEQKMPPFFKNLISILDSSKEIMQRKMARYLLMLPDENIENIEEFISHGVNKINQYVRGGKHLTSYMAFNYQKEFRNAELPIIMIFILKSSNPLLKDIAYRRSFLVDRVITMKEDVQCLMVGLNSVGSIQKIVYEEITSDYFSNLSPKILETVVKRRKQVEQSRIIRQ